jgi:hypothetical protein
MSYPKDGVVSFSITQGLSLTTGVYDYQANPNGPVITPKNGYLDISRAPQSAANQWTNFGIKVAKPVATGLIHQFNISYSKIDVRSTSFGYCPSSPESLPARYGGQVNFAQ